MLDKLVIIMYNAYTPLTEPQPSMVTCPPIVCYRQRGETPSVMLGVSSFILSVFISYYVTDCNFCMENSLA